MNIAKYASVFNIGIQNTFVYRWNYFLRALFGLIPLAGTVFLWAAVFKERGGGLHGYDYGSMIYYYLLTLLVSNLVVPTEDEWQIAADIREGQINALLTKPMSYLAYRTSIFLSGRLVYSLVTLPPIALIFIYFREYIVLPADPLIYVLTAISTVMAAFIQFFITYSLAMWAFWILEISTIVFIVYSFEYFLGGQMFPIDIMPAAVQAVMKWLPFYYELFCPVAIFLGRLKGADLVRLASAHMDVGTIHVATRPRPLPGRRRIARRLRGVGQSCSGRRAACEIQKRSRHGCLYKFISAPARRRVFGSADHSGADRTSDRAGAAQE